MTTIHMVLCTVGEYDDTITLAVRACRTVERASQLIGELNGIYEREIESIPHPKTAMWNEGYSKEEEKKKREEYYLKRGKAEERVKETYLKEYGLNIPEYYDVWGISFWMLESVLED